MNLHRYARHLRGASVDLGAIVRDSLRVMGPRLRGYARRAMPRATGLLRSSIQVEASTEALALTTAPLSGPRWPGRGTTHHVADYAAEMGGTQAVSAMEWAQGRLQGLIRRGVRKAIATHNQGGA